MFFTWVKWTAGFGNRTTTAAPGRPSSTRSPRSLLEPSPSRLPTRILFTSRPAKACSGRTSRSATAFINPPMAARPGRIWASATASRFLRSPLIRATRTTCLPPCSGIPTARTPSAAFTARRTAARIGKRFFMWTKTPAARTSKWTRRTPTSFTPASGKLGRVRGSTGTLTAGRAAASTSPPTEERPGRS